MLIVILCNGMYINPQVEDISETATAIVVSYHLKDFNEGGPLQVTDGTNYKALLVKKIEKKVILQEVK